MLVWVNTDCLVHFLWSPAAARALLGVADTPNKADQPGGRFGMGPGISEQSLVVSSLALAVVDLALMAYKFQASPHAAQLRHSSSTAPAPDRRVWSYG